MIFNLGNGAKSKIQTLILANTICNFSCSAFEHKKTSKQSGLLLL
ncbi:hypothetical protein SAMN04487979_12950 [Flavobacterium sp. ov086]|nr:hypothetical protein SAMN04487979_12950 [Flavobacterium sp. ov086]